MTDIGKEGQTLTIDELRNALHCKTGSQNNKIILNRGWSRAGW